jgi:hypothetical protein
LLSKYGSKASDDEVKDYQSFCAQVDQLNLSAHESMKLKIAAKAQFQSKKDGE